MSRFETAFTRAAFRFAVVATVLMGIAIAHSASAAIYVMIPGVPGDVTLAGWDGEHAALEVRLEPGKNGGVATFTFPKGRGANELIRRGLNGERFDLEVAIVDEQSGETLQYKLDRCWVKSWSTSGDADDRPTEEVAFYYNRIAFGY